jgi:hypothetical protein
LHITRTITARALCAALLTASGLAAPMMLAAPADAAACSGSISAGTSCTSTGTLTLNGGALSAKPPTALGWTGTLDGTDLDIVDGTAADQAIEVDDLTGSGAGWHVTASATTFKGTVDSAHTLADDTLSLNASLSDPDDTTKPTPACVGSTECTLPTSTSTYPVTFTTADTSPVAKSIYSADAGTGLGKINLGGLGWWVHVPAGVVKDTYTSTITFSVISAP